MENEFLRICRMHAAAYPQMQPQDYAKLAYQSEYGPEHLINDLEAAVRNIRAEWMALPQTDSTDISSPPSFEPIGNGLCRYHLTGSPAPYAPDCLAWLFERSAREHAGRPEGLEARLVALETLHVPGMAGWLTSYRTKGMPAVHHSPIYRAAYQPHYRVLKAEYACYFPVLLAVYRLKQTGKPAVIAIDGRCGSGKSSLAALIDRLFPCNVLHTDDYYLPLSQRIPGWEDVPGANMDFARLRQGPLADALAGRPVRCRAYSCQRGELLPEIQLSPKQLTVLEGSYSLHPALDAPCALRVFLDCIPDEQARRLRQREGDYFSMFQRRWIPLEERYHVQHNIRQNCEIHLDTSDFLPLFTQTGQSPV